MRLQSVPQKRVTNTLHLEFLPVVWVSFPDSVPYIQIVFQEELIIDHMIKTGSPLTIAGKQQYSFLLLYSITYKDYPLLLYDNDSAKREKM
jgi:hypothetical protein